MKYHEISPSAAAARYVKCYWIMEDDSPTSEPQRIVPDGRSELILNFAEPFESNVAGKWQHQPRSFFAGQITGPLLLRSSGPARVLGIRFHPHGAGPVLGLPVRELTNSIVPIEGLSRRPYRAVQRLSDLGSPFKAVAKLDGIFGNPVTKGLDPAPMGGAVRYLERAAGQVRVATIANAAGLSLRQFQRRFREAVGISPKLFSRMQRFQRVFRATETPDTDWVDAAVRNGYFDQAHLIRDYHEFAGKAPTSLLNGEIDLARRFLRSGCMSHFSNTALIALL